VRAEKAKKLRGLKAKIYNKERFNEKVQMKKTLRAFEKKKTEGKVEKDEEGAVPAYLLDRKDHTEGKALSKQVKQKRQDKAAKFSVPIPKSEHNQRTRPSNKSSRVNVAKAGRDWLPKSPTFPKLLRGNLQSLRGSSVPWVSVSRRPT